MPLPTPKEGETKSEFMERCMPIASKEAESNAQAVAICNTQFERKDEAEMSIRADRSTLPSMTKTPEGYLRGEAIVTRTGVFVYMNQDGTIRKELRHPDDVLLEDSLSTMKLIPVTVNHPNQLVNAENASSLSIGNTGETCKVDGRSIISSLVITHADGVKAVNNGKRELSLGYTVTLVEENGVYDGEEYTHRQKNIRYNHLALVDKARAGSSARINLDGAAVQTEEKRMAKVNLDGIEYEAAQEVVNALARAQDAAKTAEAAINQIKADAQKSLDEMKKQYDELMAQADELKSQIEAMSKDRGDEAIAAMVKDRVSLIAQVSKIVEDSNSLIDKTDRQIKEIVIQAKHDGLDLSGKSDDYVSARFDAVMDGMSENAAKDQVGKTTPKKETKNGETTRSDAEDVVTSMWKKKGE